MEDITIEVSTAIVISVISLLFSIYMGMKGNKRTDTQDIEERTRERTELNCKLDMINSSTQEIKEQISSLVKDVQNHGVKIAELEQSTRSAHHRLNTLEERMNDREGKEC